jgi:tetratricopeptide (TPR) repeat protein
MTAVGRNQPCPCGSGKRYKECHGAIEAAGTGVVDEYASADSSSAQQLLDAAQRAWQSGRRAEASTGCQRVLAVEPSNFEATHMLALLEYEHGRYERAIELLRQAIELRPQAATPRHNLRLIESLPGIEDGICREVLPRLVARVEAVSDLARFAPAATVVHLVLADDAGREQHTIMERLARAFGRRRLERWVPSRAAQPVSGAHALDVEAGVHPVGGLIALVVAARSQAALLTAAHPERILLVVVRDEPCAVVDRIDEAALLADAKPGVVCANRALAERLGLPASAAIEEADPAKVTAA